MKIHIDFVHLPNVNLFKNLIKTFEKDGHELIFSVQRRGRLPQILEKELPGYKKSTFGRHRGTLYSILVESNLIRFFHMIIFILKNKPDIALNAGSFPQMIASWLFHIKNITISDDPERKYDFYFFDIFASKVIFPPIIKSRGKYLYFNALKEWSYLSPAYFTANDKVLEFYNLPKYGYFFIREVSVGSINYLGQESGLVLSFAERIPNDIPVVLSLENKSTAHLYPSHWILLQEPVFDIHSLMYFSKALVSSGDSMAREGAMLGVPSVYCGIREMKANEILIDLGLLKKLSSLNVPEFLLNIHHNGNTGNQEMKRKSLHETWDDVNEFIYDQIKQLKIGKK